MKKSLVALLAVVWSVGCGSPLDEEIVSVEALHSLAESSGSTIALAAFADKCGKPGNAPSRKCPRIFIRGDVNGDGVLTEGDKDQFTQGLKTAGDSLCPAIYDVNVDYVLNQQDVPVFHSGLNAYLNGGELPWKASLFIREDQCRKVTL